MYPMASHATSVRPRVRRTGSQFAEDLLLLKLFDGETSGRCVEVGGGNGVQMSNTLLFEQAGWTCVVVEPVPRLVAEIRRVRRATHVIEAAAGKSAATLSMRVTPDFQSSLEHDGGPDDPDLILVNVERLDVLLEGVVSPPLNFVTIDTEGTELDVLAGFSLERWRPRVVIIEDNSSMRDERVREHMARRGYVNFLRTGVNDWFAAASDHALVDGVDSFERWRRCASERPHPWRHEAFALLKERLAAAQAADDLAELEVIGRFAALCSPPTPLRIVAAAIFFRIPAVFLRALYRLLGSPARFQAIAPRPVIFRGDAPG
jgi:FkbM family methyltransferase